MSSKHAPVWPIYKRLLGYTRAYWVFMVAAVIAMVVEALAGYHFTKLMEPLVNRGFVNPEPRMAVILPLTILGLFLMRSLATWVSDYTLAKTGRSVVRDLREQVLQKYLHLPSSHFDNEATPVMVSRLNFDTEQVTQASADALKTVVADTLTIIAMLVVMLQMSVKVTLAMLLVVPLIGGIVSYVGKRYRRISRGIQDGMGTMAQTAEQSLAAQQEVKVHGTQAHEIARYSRLANRMLALNMKVEVTRAAASSVVQFLAALALAVIVWVSTREALAGKLNAGQFMGLMTSMMAIIPSLRRLTSVQTSISRGVAAAERLFGIIDMPVERDDGTHVVQRVRGELSFEHVMLRYREDSGIALDDISFVARPGTVTAIVGRSGSGKTSLIRLVPRFYEPNGGVIRLDGVPLDDYPLADLRRQVAIVGQKVMLFDDTIAANIAYGMDATDEQIRAAAEAANAWEFIARMPQQLQTPVGENGALLSGGQRQRLAIARAILRDAPILILDEATAALDNESERLVQDALQRLMPERTTLVIAHRLSTIEHADQVLVMDHGRIVERGTHHELLAMGGLYQHLHSMQFRERQD
ncbi:lipid A export permease/ATP-binding protein MsbA [Stenotrophomonas maltophilia]|jgi:subfamily B ATP-binding cassette protein MsbA|uniref:Lipid A export permease/ATP-binding protein MsbA n=1 Tax=Stenotrophomonas maltophilia TaxID=40324 RepID=A0AAP7GV13_STEMA|nr:MULTISPECIES: lipid A export permease/ATP-binding protein MsbA [Stenotrophomonas]KOQ67219.1 lipid transporter ATP-binding/permease [Stenotrophomonas maltophilia]MBA0221230.1 lipid A export permease/ATP-binding protein MsbA [Stenotrophomonas maltophilia]MBE5268749.1 lipid A export permease/ATP-binding protein MsbA [Stenotrophomonas sp. B2]MBH1591787.1 lipid A export permease/ATP-binding protein MsbA [Stenotrophomonas maltophilia]MBH1663633.1 lipid A export permease/ATP-binding protein MsbA [